MPSTGRLNEGSRPWPTTVQCVVTEPAVDCARQPLTEDNIRHGALKGALAGLAEFELELGLERRTVAREARRVRGQAIGRPKALDPSKAALARRMQASGEPVKTIAETLKVSRATVYRALSEEVE